MNAELLGRIKQCPNLPSLPAIAVQVLELAQQPTMDISEIARIISKDPALSSKILRTVNSNFYGRSHAISTINHALVVLGLQSVKTLVLTFSLATNLSKNTGKGFKHLSYWRRSIYSATAARIICGKVNLVQQEEAFLAALLSDIGMLVLESVLSVEYNEVCAKATTHQELLKAESEALGTTHAEVGTVLAEHWKLPPVLVSPIAYSHNPDEAPDAALKQMAGVVELAGFCGDVFVDQEAAAAAAIAAVRRIAADRYKLAETDADALLKEIGERTKEVAGLFEINIGSQAKYEAILEKSRDLLAEMSIQQSMQHQQQSAALQTENQALQQKASTDALTKLANRARFDEYLREQYAGGAGAMPLTLLLLDLDRFKSINDKYGHQIGDAVLTAVAGELKQASKRPQDLAARYGGEEMVLVLPGTGREKAGVIADMVRRAIGAKKIKCGTLVLSVTVSIGVATAEAGGVLTTPAHLLKAADLAVYAAKHGGRNCVKVFALKTPAAA